MADALDESLGLPEELQKKVLPQPLLRPPMIPAPSATPPIAPTIAHTTSPDASPTGVPMYKQGDAVPATGTAPPVNPHIAEIQRLEQTGSGVQQLQQHHPFWGGVLRGLDVAGTIVAPRIAASIPGTTMHHNVLLGQQEGLANQDVRREQEQAQTAASQAETQRIEHPVPREEEEGKTVTTDEGVFQWNPATHRYDTKVGDAPDKSSRGQVVQTDQGPVVLQPGKTEGTPITVGGQPTKAPDKKGNDFEQFYKDYITENNLPDSAHNRLIARKEYSQAGHITVANEGTWQMAEDDKGQPILFNSKTGETKAAPANMHPKGSYAKGAGAGDKALNYANEYLKSGAFTGAGDEALQEQFFSLAKPDSGFRMTAPQIQQLRNSESWLEQAKGKGIHAVSGGWFSDEQRQQIVKTMNDLANANKAAHGGVPQSVPITSTPAGNVQNWHRDASGKLVHD